MPDYEALQATASKLITDAGQSLTFNRETSTAFNPVTGVDTVTPSTYSGYGAGFDYKKDEINDLIQSGDVRLVLESVTTKPLIGDTVTYNSEIYRVIDVNELAPNGTIIIYQLQLRR